MTPDLLQQQIKQEFDALCAMAWAMNYVVTVTNEPKQPLAMGHYKPVVDVRPKRGTY